jgi:hypothetical protein
MNIPEILAVELTASKNSITRQGELPADCRGKILRLFEDLSVAEHANAGYLRRSRLALICAQESIRRIIPYESVGSVAKAMILNGSLAISGKYDLKTLERENGNFHTEVINLLEHGDTAFVAVYAGMACFSAINTILYDTNFELIGKYEKDVPPDDWDSSFYGSLAAAGSAVWESKNGQAERLKYWRWYLEEAIPRAWDIDLSLEPLRVF